MTTYLVVMCKVEYAHVISFEACVSAPHARLAAHAHALVRASGRDGEVVAARGHSAGVIAAVGILARDSEHTLTLFDWALLEEEDGHSV
jgi:hypothetical protein